MIYLSIDRCLTCGHVLRVGESGHSHGWGIIPVQGTGYRVVTQYDNTGHLYQLYRPRSSLAHNNTTSGTDPRSYNMTHSSFTDRRRAGPVTNIKRGGRGEGYARW